MNQIDRETYKEIHKVYIEDIFKGTCWTISDFTKIPCRYVKPPARKWLIIRSDGIKWNMGDSLITQR